MVFKYIYVKSITPFSLWSSHRKTIKEGFNVTCGRNCQVPYFREDQIFTEISEDLLGSEKKNKPACSSRMVMLKITFPTKMK